MEAMDSFYWVCWHKSTAAACSQAEASGPAGHWHPLASPSSTFHPKITFPFVKKAKKSTSQVALHFSTPHTTTESVQQTNSVIMLGKTIGSRSVSYHHSPMLWLLHLSSQYLSQQPSQGAIIGNTNWMLNCANCEVKYSWEVLWEGENVQAPPLTILPVARSKLIIGLNFTVLSICSVKKNVDSIGICRFCQLLPLAAGCCRDNTAWWILESAISTEGLLLNSVSWKPGRIVRGSQELGDAGQTLHTTAHNIFTACWAQKVEALPTGQGCSVASALNWVEFGAQCSLGRYWICQTCLPTASEILLHPPQYLTSVTYFTSHPHCTMHLLKLRQTLQSLIHRKGKAAIWVECCQPDRHVCTATLPQISICWNAKFSSEKNLSIPKNGINIAMHCRNAQGSIFLQGRTRVKICRVGRAGQKKCVNQLTKKSTKNS